MEGIELTNQESIKTFGEQKKNYKYLGIFEADIIKQTEIKEKERNTSKSSRNQTPQQKFHQRNKYLGRSCIRYYGLVWLMTYQPVVGYLMPNVFF